MRRLCLLSCLFSVVLAAGVQGAEIVIEPSGNAATDTAAIQNAIRSNRSVRLAKGTFFISSPLVLGTGSTSFDGLTIRGAGPGLTVLSSSIPKTDPADVAQSVFVWTGAFSDSIPLTATTKAGDTTLSLGTTSGMAEGTYLLLITKDPNTGIGEDGTSELHRIVRVDQNRVTLERPVDRDMKPSTFVAWRTSPIRNLVLSDFTITGTATCGVEIHSAESCVIERVEISDLDSGVGINLDHAGNFNVVRDIVVGGLKHWPDHWGISFESQNGSRIERCTSAGDENAFSINQPTEVTIRDSVGHGNRVNSILLLINGDEAHGFPAQNATVIGGDYSHSNVGIGIAYANDTTIIGARVRDNETHGILVLGTCTRTLFSNLSIQGNKVWGIAFSDPAHQTDQKVIGCQYVPFAGPPPSLGNISSGMLNGGSAGWEIAQCRTK